MPRLSRIDFFGARHHVANRGARRQAIFFGDDSKVAFLSLLADFPERFGVSVHAYALLTNHYHLFVTSHRGNLADAMRHLDGEYARALNKAYTWDGPLFKGRYFNCIVSNEAYVRHLIAYIHLNPVEAGMVADLDAYDWSSHRAYAGADGFPHWLDSSDLGNAYGNGELYREFVNEVRSNREVAPDGFDPADIWKLPAGTFGAAPGPADSSFDRADLGVREAAIAHGPLTVEDPDFGASIAQVARVTGADPQRLLHPTPGRLDQRPRWLLVWWACRAGAMRRVDVARRLRIGRSAVTQTLTRLSAARARGDAEIERWIEELIAAKKNRVER